MRVYTWLQLLTVLGKIPVSAALLAGHQAARLRSAALERSIPGLLSPPSLSPVRSRRRRQLCVRACVRARARVESDSTPGLRFLRKAQLSQFCARLIAALIVFVGSDKESRYHLSIPPIYYELPFFLLFALLHRC